MERVKPRPWRSRYGLTYDPRGDHRRGIGGATAGCALAQAGVEVSVYEAAPELKEIGAGVALHPNAMRVLRMIGVEDAVRKVAGRSEWMVTRDARTGGPISTTV